LIITNLLTHNDLLYVKNLIPQLFDFSDEVYVCDSFSDDGTWEWLNENKRLKVFQNKWEWDMAKQRNFLLEKNPKDSWAIRIDSDEVPTFGLRATLRKTLERLGNYPVADRIIFSIFHLHNDLTHCDDKVGEQIRIYWNGEDVNLRYENTYKKTHEIGKGDFKSNGGLLLDEQGIVHLKFLDENKVRSTETDFLANNMYTQEQWEMLSRPENIIELPKVVGYSLTNELIGYLKCE
jgi:glycosyltransferase involved in cell wall biosynthesis